MMRALDHLVQVVHDLDVAADFFEKVGFRIPAEAQHPFGTANRCIQIGNAYLELLTIKDPSKVIERAEGTFSFSAFNRDFAQDVGEGVSGLVLRSDDPDAEQNRLLAAEQPTFKQVEFGRMAEGADGIEREVAFRATHTEVRGADHLSVFFNHHLKPENFFSKELASHANGAGFIGQVFITSETVEETAAALALATGVKAGAESGAVALVLDQTTVWVMHPQALCNQFHVELALDPSTMPRLMGYIIFVPSLDPVRLRLDHHEIEYSEHPGHLILSPDFFGGGFFGFREV